MQTLPKRIETKKTSKPKLRLVESKKNRQNAFFKYGMTLTLIIASLALIKVAQYSFYNQYSLENEQLRVKITAQKQYQQELFSRDLAFKSPERIAKIAQERLNMIKPNQVNYIIYDSSLSGQKLAFR